jgi:hypothetical protein
MDAQEWGISVSRSEENRVSVVSERRLEEEHVPGAAELVVGDKGALRV